MTNHLVVDHPLRRASLLCQNFLFLNHQFQMCQVVHCPHIKLLHMIWRDKLFSCCLEKNSTKKKENSQQSLLICNSRANTNRREISKMVELNAIIAAPSTNKTTTTSTMVTTSRKVEHTLTTSANWSVLNPLGSSPRFVCLLVICCRGVLMVCLLLNQQTSFVRKSIVSSAKNR